MPSTDPFISERLIYRAISPADFSLFQKINDDRLGYVNSNVKNIHLPKAEDTSAFQKSVSDAFLGAIICLQNPDFPQNSDVKYGEPIGQVHLKSISPHMSHHRNSEVGIDVLPEYQGEGYGSEAIRWVLDYAFRRAGLHRVNIRAFGWNEGAWKLYERLGFKREGVMREELWHEGRWWDGILMGMLDREWFEMQAKDSETKDK